MKLMKRSLSLLLCICLLTGALLCFTSCQKKEVTVDLSKLPQITISQLVAFVGVGTASLEGSTLTIAGQTSVILR